MAITEMRKIMESINPLLKGSESPINMEIKEYSSAGGGADKYTAINGKNLITDMLGNPAIGREDNWAAMLDSYDPKSRIGMGSTEDEAIADLNSQIQGDIEAVNDGINEDASLNEDATSLTIDALQSAYKFITQPVKMSRDELVYRNAGIYNELVGKLRAAIKTLGGV